MMKRHNQIVSPKSLLLVNIGQLLTLRSHPGRSGPRRGEELRELGIIEGGAVLCVSGKIVSVGKSNDALRDPWVKKHRKKLVEIDCSGKVVVPGFVDSHTHPAFISPRLVDFEKRIAGATYEDIAESGGGIRSSVDAVRQAGKRLLADKVLAALSEMHHDGRSEIRIRTIAWCGTEISGSGPRGRGKVARNSGPDAAWRTCGVARISGQAARIRGAGL